MKKFSCSSCAAVWQKNGRTNCWSANPDEKPLKPGYCPSQEHMDIIQESFDCYKGDSADAKMAQVLAAAASEHIVRLFFGDVQILFSLLRIRHGI